MRPHNRDLHGHDHHAHGPRPTQPDHDHQHGHATVSERRRMLATLILTTALMITEFVGGLVSGSLALRSDAAHLLTDVAALGLSWFALVLAARPPDPRRTYGFHRLEILAALINGVVLLALSIWLLAAAYQGFRNPVPIRADLVVVVALVGLFAMSIGMLLLRGSHSLNVRSAYLHVAGDALTSIAVLGGGVLMHFRRHLSWIDPLLSSVIGLVVIASAFRLIREAVHVLLEAVPADIDLAEVVKSLQGIAGVRDVHDLHIWTITSGMHALSVHVVAVPDLPPAAHDALLTCIKEMLLHKYAIAHSTLHIESAQYEHVGHNH